MNWRKGKITIKLWCKVHKVESTLTIEGEQLSVFAVHHSRNDAIPESWFGITHKPTGFNFLWFPTIEGAKKVAEYMEENYIPMFESMTFSRKRDGEPHYDTKHATEAFLKDQTLMTLIKENAVAFSELVKRKITTRKSKFKW